MAKLINRDLPGFCTRFLYATKKINNQVKKGQKLNNLLKNHPALKKNQIFPTPTSML